MPLTNQTIFLRKMTSARSARFARSKAARTAQPAQAVQPAQPVSFARPRDQEFIFLLADLKALNKSETQYAVSESELTRRQVFEQIIAQGRAVSMEAVEAMLRQHFLLDTPASPEFIQILAQMMQLKQQVFRPFPITRTLSKTDCELLTLCSPLLASQPTKQPSCQPTSQRSALDSRHLGHGWPTALSLSYFAKKMKKKKIHPKHHPTPSVKNVYFLGFYL